jgi:hypothetical protein
MEHMSELCFHATTQAPLGHVFQFKGCKKTSQPLLTGKAKKSKVRAVQEQALDEAGQHDKAALGTCRPSTALACCLTSANGCKKTSQPLLT